MELPRPHPVSGEAGGGRKATHDFLSLCANSSSSSSTLHQDPLPRPQPAPPPSPAAASPPENSLETRDFLGRTVAPPMDRPHPPLAGPLQTLPLPASVEHSLPGGIGTYSISHISYFNRKLPGPKPETAAGMRPFTVIRAGTMDRTDENSNSSSYANNGFTLWEESAGKKGKARKENVRAATTAHRESGVQLGRSTVSDKPAQSISNNDQCRSPFSSFSSSQPSGQKNKGFVDAMKNSTKDSSNQEDEFDDEEMEFVVKKESSPIPRAELRVKIDGKCSEQKANTPRSKHSATEQRRRSKINDRFQMLRALIPRSDQKRDRASFLMEVIEYIQMLQEKVTKYEGSYPGWTCEPVKPMPLRNGHKPGNNCLDRFRPTNNGSKATTVLAAEADEDNDTLMSGIPRSAHEPSETDVSSESASKAAPPHPLAVGRNVFPFPISIHPDLSAIPKDGCQAGHVLHGMAAGLGRIPRTGVSIAALDNKLKGEGSAVEGGSTSFSDAYSHGLLKVLTQVLQNSGVDLSQSSISVQIELSKRGNLGIAATSPFPKEDVDAASKMKRVSRTQVGTEDPERAAKKLKSWESRT
ncbi:hypothetical protein MLD38_025027 [Melastoma candidum]|uniref:Uncharacterized protein n=1 Tax=Melastoma candidum TaxID=119954 RepID=A0ACB9NUI7_9MYRT|nr:hypothetical protein MLD38_025027 [Melastoma candidum]